MHSIKYSKHAQIDIDEIILGIATESKINALAYLSRYEEKIELLRLNPYMGVECKNKLIKRDCRVLVHESHMVVYKVMEDTTEIYLIRIFHGSVDYAKKVNNERIR
jgi:plasmid stabilization system protein ParE